MNVRLMSAEIWRAYYAQNKSGKVQTKITTGLSKNKRKRSSNDDQTVIHTTSAFDFKLYV